MFSKLSSSLIDLSAPPHWHTLIKLIQRQELQNGLREAETKIRGEEHHATCLYVDVAYGPQKEKKSRSWDRRISYSSVKQLQYQGI
ncbi:hypothetical protein K1719_017654 [Acacia pycnantha]|nr:hypothetical protein K1719_043919 [Acacia pycnantha]KAI9111964.1 hypothetical protein K1719_017654 [Acacia pycnantha]